MKIKPMFKQEKNNGKIWCDAFIEHYGTNVSEINEKGINNE